MMPASTASTTQLPQTPAASDQLRWPLPKPASTLSRGSAAVIPWLWEGCLARGHSSLLSALPKAGKTTLLAYLLRQLQAGDECLGLATKPTRTILVTEESEILWARRRDSLRLDDHLGIISRPFLARPSHAAWQSFVGHLLRVARDQKAALVAFDTIGKFAPWINENDSADVTNALMPLDRLTRAGHAVLLTHHNGKSDQREGKAIRGSTALTASADILLELRRFRPADSRDCRRVLSGMSRLDGAPNDLLVSLEADGSYVAEGDRAIATPWLPN